MKNLILFVLLLTSLQAFGQKKGKVDPKDVTIDSLKKVSMMLATQLDSTTKASSALSISLDSVSKERDTYYGVYATVKDKVLMYNYHPDSLSHIIDSLRANRDASLAAVTTAAADSISELNTEITNLKGTISKMEAATAEKDKLVAELKQLKELLDSGIISKEEFDTKKDKLMAKWE